MNADQPEVPRRPQGHGGTERRIRPCLCVLCGHYYVPYVFIGVHRCSSVVSPSIVPIGLTVMDELTSGIIAFNNATLASKIDYAVAKKVLDNQEMQGASALKLIAAAAKGFNQAGDKLVSAATGLGGEIDTYA